MVNAIIENFADSCELMLDKNRPGCGVLWLYLRLFAEIKTAQL